MKMSWGSWAASGLLRPVDTAFAQFLLEKAPGLSAPVVVAAALTSYQLGRGHVCLDLDALVDDPRATLGLNEAGPDPEMRAQIEALVDRAPHAPGFSAATWAADLCAADVVVASEGSAMASSAPLILGGHRLYLRRYWRYECEVEAAIIRRLKKSSATASALPRDLFRTTLEALFPSPRESAALDWQKVACALAARSPFSVLTGGPGTGKTTTVVCLLALLQRLALDGPAGRALRVALAAPTGKAAARLRASLAGALHRLAPALRDHPGLLASIPSEVATVHRLLGVRFDRRAYRYGPRERLPLDLLVIDEASMIDLEMMAAVVRALPDEASLVLLGDKDQLSSVEAGAVLGQLCARASTGHYLPETIAWLKEMAGQSLPATYEDQQGRALDQQVVMLRTSHRFTETSGIGRLAAAVHKGDAEGLASVLAAGHHDIRLRSLRRPFERAFDRVFFPPEMQGIGESYLSAFAGRIASHRPALDSPPEAFSRWAQGVLAVRAEFQVLCALRDGPLGVLEVNRIMESLLSARGLIAPHSLWYEGRPVLMTRNDYALGLMNGDMGITLRIPVQGLSGRPETALRVAFPRDDGEEPIRWVLPSRLDAVETAFALTVHKSQGSEFDHCLLVMPEAASPVVTRELLYTGITRARLGFSLVTSGDPTALVLAAMQRGTRRSGGLSSRVFPNPGNGL